MDAVAGIAEVQYGLITRHQARAVGLSESAIDRRVRSRRWVTVFPGVYRIAGAPMTDGQRLRAATLWGGPDCVLSHESAISLLRLAEVRSAKTHITVPYVHAPRAAEIRVHRTIVMPDIDRRLVDGIGCTSATRTLIDCAADLDDEALEAASEKARRHGLTTVSLLRRRADELCGAGRRGSGSVRRLIASTGKRAVESRLEVKTARILRGSALPEPVRQFWVGPYRLDFVWPPGRVGLRVRRLRVAWQPAGVEADRRRLAWLEAAGWRIVLVTWDDVTMRPAETIDRLLLALRDAAA
jgi:very-short-patch-repair endonuclease